MEKVPKKRGRKPKNEYYLTKKIDKVDTENKAMIINLPIKIDYVNKKNSEREQEIIRDLSLTIAPYEDDYSIFTSSYNKEETEELFIKSNAEESRETTENTERKSYYDMNVVPRTLDVKDISIKLKTDIHCFWCCHQFDNSPVFMPYNLKGDVFIVKGIFCSFECCFSYMSDQSRYYKNIHLLKYMYYLYTGKKFFRESLKKAPEKECLKIFGGPLTIEEFRKDCNSYEILKHPMSYVSGLIEKAHKIPSVKQNKNKTSFLGDFVKKI